MSGRDRSRLTPELEVDSGLLEKRQLRRRDETQTTVMTGQSKMTRKRSSQAPQRSAKRQKKNQILLSKSMNAVYQATSIPRVLCKLVGVFAGTDIGVNVGDVIIRSTILKRGCMYDARPTPGVLPEDDEGRLHDVYGKLIEGLRVEQVTAARAVVRVTVSNIIVLKMNGLDIDPVCFQTANPTAYSYKTGQPEDITRRYGPKKCHSQPVSNKDKQLIVNACKVRAWSNVKFSGDAFVNWGTSKRLKKCFLRLADVEYL